MLAILLEDSALPLDNNQVIPEQNGYIAALFQNN